MSLPRAALIGPGDGAVASVTLSYAGRLLRRKRLEADDGTAFLVDLPHTTDVRPGQGFILDDTRVIAVEAAAETLLSISGDIPRLAWHIGNRHTPCEITATHLIIQHDPVLRDMVLQLGGTVEDIIGPFRPEGGAYGHGRTLGHEH
ncbi:MAG: urease accessory protein UreE [Pseudomonadota bacterium]